MDEAHIDRAVSALVEPIDGPPLAQGEGTEKEDGRPASR